MAQMSSLLLGRLVPYSFEVSTGDRPGPWGYFRCNSLLQCLPIAVAVTVLTIGHIFGCSASFAFLVYSLSNLFCGCYDSKEGAKVERQRSKQQNVRSWSPVENCTPQAESSSIALSETGRQEPYYV